MERCSVDYQMTTPLMRIWQMVKQTNNQELITEVEYLLEEEEEIIKTAYEDAVDFVIMGIMSNEDWPTAEEYYAELFNNESPLD